MFTQVSTQSGIEPYSAHQGAIFPIREPQQLAACAPKSRPQPTDDSLGTV